MQVIFPVSFSSFYLCSGRIKGFEVHSYLFCIDCVLVSSSEKVLLPGCRKTCPVQSLVVILAGASENCHGSVNEYLLSWVPKAYQRWPWYPVNVTYPCEGQITCSEAW